MGGERLCACGCGRSLVDRRPQCRYFDGACRARHARAEGRGCLPPVRAPKTAQKQHTPPARRLARSGVSVYFRDPGDLDAVLDFIRAANGDSGAERTRGLVDAVIALTAARDRHAEKKRRTG